MTEIKFKENSAGIRVPEKYRSELRSNTSKEYKEAQIRDYVKAHKGEVVKIADLMPIVGTNVQTYIARLIKEGRLGRRTLKTGARGYSYTYVWYDQPHIQATSNGPVHVKSLGYKDYPLGGVHGNLLMGTSMHEYIETNLDTLPAEQIKGMLLFKRHINQKHTEVEQYNKDILKGGNDEKDTTS